MRKTLLFFLFVLCACGRKSALVPVSELYPAPITDLRAIGREDRVILLWTAPGKDIRGASIKNLKQFIIMRESVPMGNPPCPGCPAHSQVVSTISPPGEKNFFDGGSTVEFSDSPLTYGMRYRYKVIPVTDRRGTGKESNPAVVSWDVPPAPPGELKGLPGDRYSLLSWNGPELRVDGTPLTHTAGYMIYRREEGGAYPLFPVNSFPVTETTYTDGGLENHKQYFYAVRALVKVQESILEGPPSNEILLVPRRLDLPSRPEGVSGACTKGGIEITWKKTDDPEVVGYNVYRRKKGETRVIKLTDKPIDMPHYRDTAMKIKALYLYSVRAIEGPPLERESLASDEVRVTCR